MKKQPFTLEEFKSIYSRVPRLNVEVVIKTLEGVVLTFREDFGWENQWHIPGGTVYMNEYLEDAVKRVAFEEVGVRVKIEELLGYIHYPSEKEERGFGWPVGIAFLCSTKDEPRQKEGADKLKLFKKLPDNVIKEQADFLRKTGLIN